MAAAAAHSNPPAGGSAGGPTVQGLKKAKRKEKMKAKNEKKHRLQSLEAASSSNPDAAVCTSPAHANFHNKQHDECSLCLEAPVTK
jgi:hypothetical protein